MELSIKTNQKEECIDITNLVKNFLGKSEVKEGLINIYTPHTTAAIIINENNDPNIQGDFLSLLNKIIPQGIWKHDKIDGNAAAHIKASIIGSSQTIPVEKGKMQLGKWQSIMFVELDGPRQRRIIFTEIESKS